VSRCEDIRELLHRRLDGELAADLATDLDGHLADCADCRAAAAGLAAVAAGLAALPEHPFPETAFEAVLDRTRRSRRSRFRSGLAASWPAWAGAAAVLVLALLMLRPAPAPGTPTSLEVARASREARMVLTLASRAVRRAEQVAGRRVLAGEVAPALRRLPIRWASGPGPRKS
jgi:predicted anti-sigma-YlaC factor YlaD